MKYWRYIICLATCSLSSTLISAMEQSEECCFYNEPFYSEPSWYDELTYSPLRIDVAGLVGEGIGGDNQNCSLDIFYSPTMCEDWQPFIEIKGHHLGSSADEWAANAGIGVRWLTCNRTFGANLFYDYRHHRHHPFSQIGIGLESLGDTVDFRINGYIPFKQQSSTATVFDDYIGDYIVEAIQYWNPMAGIDGEVGVSMFDNCWFRLYGALGPYYYRTINTPAHISDKDAFGGMFRLALQCTDFIDLEVKVSYDTLFKTKVQGILQLTLPFDTCFNICNWTKCASPNVFLKPVERREIIVLHHSGLLWEGNY